MASNEPVKTQLRFRWTVFLNVFLASIVLGGLAHELIHLIFIPYTAQLTINLSNPSELLSVCCFQQGEEVYESVAVFVQVLAMLVWILLNLKVCLYEVPVYKTGK